MVLALMVDVDVEPNESLKLKVGIPAVDWKSQTREELLNLYCSDGSVAVKLGAVSVPTTAIPVMVPVTVRLPFIKIFWFWIVVPK